MSDATERELRIRLEGRVERLEVARDRLVKLNEGLADGWSGRVSEWSSLVAPAIAEHLAMVSVLDRVRRESQFSALLNEVEAAQQALAGRVDELARKAGLPPGPWHEVLPVLQQLASTGSRIVERAEAPLLSGPPVFEQRTLGQKVRPFAMVAVEVAVTVGLVMLKSPLACLFGFAAVTHLSTYALAGFGGVPRPLAFSFQIHGKYLIRTGEAGVGVNVELARCSLVPTETGWNIAVDGDPRVIPVPRDWPGASLLRLLCDAARAGLLDDADASGGAAIDGVVTDAGAQGAVLSWSDVFVFVADSAAQEAVAAATGKRADFEIKAVDVLRLLRHLNSRRVRSCLASFVALPGVCVWPQGECEVLPLSREPGQEDQFRLSIVRGPAALHRLMSASEAQQVSLAFGVSLPGGSP